MHRYLRFIVERYNLDYTRAFQPIRDDETDLDDYFVVNIPESALNQTENIIADFKESGLLDSWEWNESIQLDPIETTDVSTQRRNVKKYGLNDPDINQLWGFEVLKMDELYGQATNE